LRVIAGLAKGRRLVDVPGDSTRPITDMVKEALFNILGESVEDTRWLDLFAGTGGVGIEALSRGAAGVVFIDRARQAVQTIRKNLEITGLAGGAEVVQGDAFRYLRNAPPDSAFDVIYVAPPQYQELWAQALLALNERPLLHAEGRIIVQIHPKEYHALATPRLRLEQERRYGSTMLYFYALNQLVVRQASILG
jgi:16S rRNA (guanine(966)-N(2))-methyltransferase RsmD